MTVLLRHGIELDDRCFSVTDASHAKLPCSSGLCLALPGLAVDVVRRGVVESDLFLGLIVGLEKRLVNSLLVSSKTSNGLIVGKLGQLEQHGIVEGRLRILVRLQGELACAMYQ